MTAQTDVTFGRGTCCWKPAGCTKVDGCRLLAHPLKRAAAGDPTAPCPMTWVEGDTGKACSLLNGHDGDCVARV